MPMGEDDQLESQLELIRTAQQRSTRRLVGSIGLTMLLGLGLVALCFYWVSQLQARAAEAQTRFATAETKLVGVQTDLRKAESARDAASVETEKLRQQTVQMRADMERLQTKLDDAASFGKFLHPLRGGGAMDLKGMQGEPWGQLYLEMIRAKEQGTPYTFKLNDGKAYNSPGFMARMLVEGRTPIGRAGAEGDLTAVLKALEACPKRADGKPQSGDIVRYRSGYLMLHLRDTDGKPFVLGMTPLGVLPMEPGFADVEAVYTPWTR